MAVRTPAVAEDGKIFCLCTAGTIHDHRTPSDAAIHTSNFIVGVKDDGTVFGTFPIPTAAGPDLVPVNGVVDGAPRILSSGIAAKVVFLVRYTYQVPYPELGPGARGPMVASYVGVLDLYDVAGGGLRFHPYDEQKEFVDAHGGGGLGGSARLGPPADFPGPKLSAGARACANTPVVFGTFASTGLLTIIAPTDKGLHRFYYNQEFFNVIPAGQLAMPGTFPGPAAFPNGLIANIANNYAILADAESFTRYNPGATPLWRDATVAGGLRQMYFLTRQGTLLAVDTNGAVWKERQLAADSVAFPALTLNHVHVATAQGLRTFDLALDDVSSVDLPDAGYSSPAVDANGSVFVATNTAVHGFLNTRLSPLVGPAVIR
jgi:hypothetical protein